MVSPRKTGDSPMSSSLLLTKSWHTTPSWLSQQLFFRVPQTKGIKQPDIFFFFSLRSILVLAYEAFKKFFSWLTISKFQEDRAFKFWVSELA